MGPNCWTYHCRKNISKRPINCLRTSKSTTPAAKVEDQIRLIQFNNFIQLIQFNYLIRLIQFNNLIRLIQFNNLIQLIKFNNLIRSIQFNNLIRLIQFNNFPSILFKKQYLLHFGILNLRQNFLRVFRIVVISTVGSEIQFLHILFYEHFHWLRTSPVTRCELLLFQSKLQGLRSIKQILYAPNCGQ